MRQKVIRIFAATILYLLLLIVIYALHVSYLSVNVVFYSAILDGIVAAVVASAALFGISYFDQINQMEKALLVIIWLLCGYSLAISIPTVIDRSLSFYILEKLQQRGGGIEVSRFEDVFTKEYVNEHRLVDVRLTEQAQSGTIKIVNGCVMLTPWGARLASISRYFRKYWLPKRRLLNNKYTSDLTNPFRNSIESPGYECSQ
jgi:hypothetical protein